MSSAGLVVTCPPATSILAVEGLLADQADWARAALARLVPRAPAGPPAPGAVIELLGVPHELIGRVRPGRVASRREPGRIESTGPDAVAVWAGIERQLRAIARTGLGALLDHWLERAATGARPALSLRDPRTRWGSCTPGRPAISLSWRLVLAPAWVAGAVIAHEVVHLEHPHHGADFWARLSDLCPETGAAREWLTGEGVRIRRWPAP